MKRIMLLLVLASTSVAHGALAQVEDPPPGSQAPQSTQTPARTDRQEPWFIEMGAFGSFLTNDYGQWSGAQGRVMYRGLKHLAPIFGVAYQHRDYGSQTTLGLDSYILVNKWFYAIAGAGGSPEGSAELWPRWRYGAMGLFSLPRPKGLLGTAAYAEIHGNSNTYGRIISAGAMYYRGRAIWSGNVSFNRTYPGSVDSKSAGIALQYGAEKHYWLAVGFNGGRIAYQMFTVQPLPVEWISFGPNFFYQKWLTRKVGFIVRCDYQNQREAFQRVGIGGSIFLEVP